MTDVDYTPLAIVKNFKLVLSNAHTHAHSLTCNTEQKYEMEGKYSCSSTHSIWNLLMQQQQKATNLQQLNRTQRDETRENHLFY